MTKRIVIVGAVALGPKVACRIKRIAPSYEVVLIDKDDLISYGGCGIPYYIGGDVADLKALRSTSAHVLRDKDYFKNIKGVEVLTQTEAVAIDRRNKKLKIRNLVDGQEEQINYDKLVLATGATPVIPPLPGVDLPRVCAIANLHQAKAIKDMVSQGKVGKAVVIGGGAIGIEMAEALTDLWEVETTLIEMMDQLLPTALGHDMALPVKNHTKKQNFRRFHKWSASSGNFQCQNTL